MTRGRAGGGGGEDIEGDSENFYTPKGGGGALGDEDFETRSLQF